MIIRDMDEARDKDEYLLIGKLSSLADRTKERIEKQPDHIKKELRIIPIYISQFYGSLIDDSCINSSASAALTIFASGTREELQNVEKTLVFWWFWTFDRMHGRNILNDTNIQAALNNVWDLDFPELQALCAALDRSENENPIETLWDILRNEIPRNRDSLYGINNLRNWQIALQRNPDGTLERIIKARIADMKDRE